MNSFQSSLQLQTLVVRVLKDFITQRYESLGWVTVLSGNPFVPTRQNLTSNYTRLMSYSD